MKNQKLTLQILPLLLTGCASMTTTAPHVPEGKPSSTVLVFRSDSFVFGASQIHFGENGKYYLALFNGEYGEVTLPAGPHRFVATSRGVVDLALNVDLAAQGKTCLKVSADSSNYAKMLVPLLRSVTSPYKMEVLPCPNDDFLKSYKKVSSL